MSDPFAEKSLLLVEKNPEKLSFTSIKIFIIFYTCFSVIHVMKKRAMEYKFNTLERRGVFGPYQTSKTELFRNASVHLLID